MQDLKTDELKVEYHLPQIPSKRYFTIGEVSRLCVVKTHVLRYWEQEFPQLRPSKRRGNRRYYQHKDVVTIQKIYQLLYHHGFTIQGARQWLVAAAKKDVQPAVAATAVTTAASKTDARAVLKEAIQELQQVWEALKA